MIQTAPKLNRTGIEIDDQCTLLQAGVPKRLEPMIMAIEHLGIDIIHEHIT